MESCILKWTLQLTWVWSFTVGIEYFDSFLLDLAVLVEQRREIFHQTASDLNPLEIWPGGPPGASARILASIRCQNIAAQPLGLDHWPKARTPPHRSNSRKHKQSQHFKYEIWIQCDHVSISSFTVWHVVAWPANLIFSQYEIWWFFIGLLTKI